MVLQDEDVQNAAGDVELTRPIPKNPHKTMDKHDAESIEQKKILTWMFSLWLNMYVQKKENYKLTLETCRKCLVWNSYSTTKRITIQILTAFLIHMLTFAPFAGTETEQFLLNNLCLIISKTYRQQ